MTGAGRTLFISDLHLHPSRPALTQIFLRFLEGIAREARTLYILGDLFHQWLGDDASMPKYEPEIEALRKLSDSGVPLYLMHGNRDFLVGNALLAETGMRLLPDPYRIVLHGQPTVLTHGDFLCTDDVEHLKARRAWLDPAKQASVLAMSVREREDLAARLWEESVYNKSIKPAEIMDVTQSAVVELLRSSQVHQLIHGHTHRPAIHEFNLDGAPARRIVLSDWHDDHGSMLVCDEQGCRLQDLH